MPTLWIWLLLLGSSLAKPKLDEDCELNAADTMVGDYRLDFLELYLYIFYISLYIQHDFCCELHDESSEYLDCQTNWHKKIYPKNDRQEQVYMFVSRQAQETTLILH